MRSIDPQAIETFVRGYATTKSLTHPYEAIQFGSVWGLRDGTRKNLKNYRKEEWIACAEDDRKLLEAVTRNSRGWHFLGVFVESDQSIAPTRDRYKQLGYRLLSTEPFFIQPLSKIPNKSSPAEISRVTSVEQVNAYSSEAKVRPNPDLFLSNDTTWRHYVATVGDRVVGWVSSIFTPTNSTWCSNLVVRPEFRRQGIGGALLSKMLRDDRKYGAKSSVLLASHTGPLLYPTLGYQQKATLLILAPKQSR